MMFLFEATEHIYVFPDYHAFRTDSLLKYLRHEQFIIIYHGGKKYSLHSNVYFRKADLFQGSNWHFFLHSKPLLEMIFLPSEFCRFRNIDESLKPEEGAPFGRGDPFAKPQDNPFSRPIAVDSNRSVNKS